MNILSPSLRIGVLRGGPSAEYDVSLKTGANVLKHLSETHRPLDIFISRNGKWHMQGVERSPERILKQVDVIFNALHGAYGEDGGVQEVLNHHGVPYTGSGRLESAVAMNKWMTKERAMKAGIKTPVCAIVRQEDNLAEKTKEIWSGIPSPLIVKPACSGSSFGLYKVNSFKELLSSLETVLSEHGSAIVEEYIAGKEATCGVINNFRDQDIYALPPMSGEICPGNFSGVEKKEIERLSALIHKTLGLSHYSRSDFIISPRRGIYFLEVNTLPGLTKESLLPKSLKAIGSSVQEFLHHVIGLALNKK